MGQFDLANRIKINNPSGDNDLMYGPYVDKATALSTVVSGLRDKGRRVGILNNGAVEDWWWKSGILDTDLVIYSTGGGVSDHPGLTGRDAIDSHPISAITGLQSALDNTVKRIEENLPTLQILTPYYNFNTVHDVRGIAPTGFHVPTTADITTLVNYLGGYSVAGGALKSDNLSDWDAPNTGATNSSGFTSVGRGYRLPNTGSFSSSKKAGTFYLLNDGIEYPRALEVNFFVSKATYGNVALDLGGTVRCIKDNNTPSVGDIVDASGNKYTEVVIGTQIWLAEDLKTTRYNNGDLIPNVTDATTWSTLTTGALCYYDNEAPPKFKHVVQTEAGDVMLVDETASGNTEGQSIISDTYSNIKQLVDSNSLVPESTYIITDYQTKHLIPNSDPQEINTGNIEPLTLVAATTNTFYTEVKSSLFPSDIIHYRFDDDSCEDGSRDVENKKWTGGTSRPGYIQYRKSTTNNLSTYYDWRNYKIRRWKLDCLEWTSGIILFVKDLIKSPIDGNIYICKKVVTELNTTDPSQDTENYQLYLDLSIQNDGGYLSYTPISSDFNIGNITNTNLIINNTTPDVDYKDYYTFCILTEPTNSSGIIESDPNGIIGEGFKDFEIGKFDFEFNNWWGNATDLLGDNVFYLLPNGDSESGMYSVRIGGSFSSNTFCSEYNYLNSIGDLFQFNILQKGDFSVNTIGDSFNSNTIGNNFYSNTIGNNFYSNTIGDSFSTNTIGSGFYYNTIEDNFSYNTISNSFGYSTIGNNFYSNTIGDNFGSNTIGNYFSSNTIGNSFSYNTIGDSFQNNEVKDNITNTDWLNTVPTPIHVYQTYDCKIFKNSVGVPRLSYYDENDELIITNITA